MSKIKYTQHTGGNCPVANNTHIKIRFRNGVSFAVKKPQDYTWQHDGSLSDITGYYFL